MIKKKGGEFFTQPSYFNTTNLGNNPTYKAVDASSVYANNRPTFFSLGGRNKKRGGTPASYDNSGSYDPKIYELNDQFNCGTHNITGFNEQNTFATYNNEQKHIVGGKKKKKGGVAPYEKYVDYEDVIHYNDNDLGITKKYKHMQPDNIDDEVTYFALEQNSGLPPNTKTTTGGKKKKHKKGGSTANEVTIQDIFNIDFLGNKTPYKPLNIENIEERGTNFALQTEVTYGGKARNNKKLKIIRNFFEKTIKKSYAHYKKSRMSGGSEEEPFLTTLLVDSFKANNTNNAPVTPAHFNTKHIENYKGFQLKEPQKITATHKSNFSY